MCTGKLAQDLEGEFVVKPFFEQPILNSPYHPPIQHHSLDDDGQPLNLPPISGRRKSKLITPVPKAKKQKGGKQAELFTGESDVGFVLNPTPIINEIRQHVETWRNLPNPNDWGVTPITARLLQHWRNHNFSNQKPFFCQIEAVETAIWLSEVATKRGQYSKIWAHVDQANAEANPELMRLALKMATGAGKTTVMAMLIAWQALNAIRSPTSHFSRAFLIITPGITIKDRLRVLMPEDADSYYKDRELVPDDMLGDLGKAKIVITNYHAFKRREAMDASKVGKALLQGRDETFTTIETEGAMLQRACGDLLSFKNVIVINDEAHHCYREKPDSEEDLSSDDKDEAKRNAEAARLWISGIEALNRKVGVRRVVDLSATPFFLRGSGYPEGTLFPWTVSDFSLMDAIESGIVKLPRIPVSDNAVNAVTPVYRNLWDHIGKRMPKKGAGKSGTLDPLSIPAELQTALYALYGHYEAKFNEWQEVGIDVPPVFIVVCNNTATSKLVYEWISGFDRANEDGEIVNKHKGHLELFQNYDEHGNRLSRFNTLLIDSEQLESGEALKDDFRDMAKAEIEHFKKEYVARTGDQKAADNLTDTDLLREVMNTVGRAGKLGEQVRCVVSVSMLTEGWDTNTVTHILGVRAFGTQLLCEQVVGRGLRRLNYELTSEGLFETEYADIMGIPFDFASEPVKVKQTPPKKLTRVSAIKERAALEITFPRVQGYRVDLPGEKITAVFSDDSRYELTPDNVGPCKVRMEGIVGEGADLNADALEKITRPSEISFRLTKHLLNSRFRDPDQDLPGHLFGQVQPIVRRWLDEGWLVVKGGVPKAAILYMELAEKVCERIYLACQRAIGGEQRIKAILDPYNPTGSSRFVAFTTSKTTYITGHDRCHISHVVCDSDWEAVLTQVLEDHPKVICYIKNQGLQFDVPWRDGAVPRRYVPDFIVRVDDGRPDPLNLILEVKGFKGGDAQLKAETMNALWVPGVNNLETYGRWAFAELRDPYEMNEAVAAIIAKAIGESVDPLRSLPVISKLGGVSNV
jgi:type III restriction enzyme